MNIVTTPREDHQMEMVVEVEAERMEAAKRRAARKISEKAKIPGFRPGKAPYDIVLRFYGEGPIVEEAVELLVDEVYPAALKELNIEPGGMGQLENVESLEPPKFKFVVPLQPSVDLGDYSLVRYPYEWQAPGDSEVDEEIQNLRRMYASTETVEREIVEGDYVSLDLVGRKAKAADDAEALVERKGFAIVVRGEEKESEFPFPGFSKKLLGLKTGEGKNLSHKYAKDFDDEKLAGQNVAFEVTIKTVRGVNMPELDDEFAKKTGLGETVEQLRVRMHENIQRESQDKYDDDYFAAVIDKIKEGATIKYPPQVITHESEHVMEDLKRRLSQQGMDIATYFKVRETTEEKFLEEEAKPVAQKRLERGLIMDELARVEKVELKEEEVGQEFQQAWTNLVMYDQEFAKRTNNGKKAPKDLVDAVVMDAANRLTTRKVLDRLKLIATGQAGEAAPAEEKPAKKAKKAKAESAPEAEGQTEASAAEKPAKKKSSKKAAE